MPKVTKREELSFEEAVERLEELVTRMESGEMPLEEILTTYEEGMSLVAKCSEKLAAAEKKIELLTRDKSGNLTRSEFPKEAGEPETGADNEPDDEASLF
ncbi:MAG: exodeoxyribonuclease VII small subunit [Verrucomicrobiia bacterium]